MKDPKGMSRDELLKILHDMSKVTLENAILDFKDQWDLDDDEMTDIEFAPYIKDTSKVQHKDKKTKFIKLYQTEVKRLLDKKKLTHEDLGILTHLATYTGFENNTLRMPDDEYMTLKDMQRILGIGKTKMNELLNKYKEMDLIIQGKHPNDKRKSIFYLNPDLFFKGNKIKKKTKNFFIERKKEKTESDA